MSYLNKLEALQVHYEQSTRLAEAIGVSRRTFLNWRDRPDSIKPEHRLDIDVLYCKHKVLLGWDVPKQSFKTVLLPDKLANNDAWLMPF